MELTTSSAGDDTVYIGLSEAARRLGRSPTFITKCVVRGEVRTRVTPGRPPRYSAADLEKLKLQGME